MPLTREEVEKIARLARIRLTEEEKETLSREMGSILEYAKKLNEIDTVDIEPTAQVTGLENVFRADESAAEAVKGDPEILREQAPQRKGDHVQVKAVFEE